MRKTISLIHRYVGLTMTIFLVIVGLTGSVIAFQHELDLWLNPKLLTVPATGQPLMDPFELQALADKADPRVQVDGVTLHLEPGEAYAAQMSVRTDPVTGKPYELGFNQILFNPHTGEKLGQRMVGEVTLRPEGIIFFLYRLHYSLALPEATGRTGPLILGIVALLWTLDCFVGVYLTLPMRRKALSDGSEDTVCAGQRSWWPRWKPAWLVRWRGGTYKLNYDLHRASGLWLWAMLFVFAWSSVAFNLNEVYNPVTATLFKTRGEMPESPKLAKPLDQPALGWRDARAQAFVLATAAATAQGRLIEREEAIYLDREHGQYGYAAKLTGGYGKFEGISVILDANTGRQLMLNSPADEKTGDVVTRWLLMLHMAAVGGLAMQIFVCVMGLVITGLCVTGVVVWLKKRKGEQAMRRRSQGLQILARSGGKTTAMPTGSPHQTRV